MEITKAQIESFYEAEFGQVENLIQKAMRDISVEVIGKYEQFRTQYQVLLDKLTDMMSAKLSNGAYAFWVPKPDELIYIRSSSYMDGDVCGGLALVKVVQDRGASWDTNRYLITVREIEGHQYGWGSLFEMQIDLHREFGLNHAHYCPDDGD